MGVDCSTVRFGLILDGWYSEADFTSAAVAPAAATTAVAANAAPGSTAGVVKTVMVTPAGGGGGGGGASLATGPTRSDNAAATPGGALGGLLKSAEGRDKQVLELLLWANER